MKRAPVLFVAVLTAGTAGAQAQSSISFESEELAPGIYMLEGKGGFAGGNLGLLTGDEGTVLIDDGLEPLSETTLAAVRRLSPQSIDFVVNTHLHGDHVGGNAALRESGATIIGHEKLRKRMAAPAPDSPDSPPPEALPQVTFSESMTFHLNGHEAFVFHVQAAHTDGDSVIFFRDADVIHTGDVLFNGMFPFIDLDSGGSVEGYLKAQEDVLSIASQGTRIIPGHGPVASKDDLQAAHDMLSDAVERVRTLVEEGRSIDEVLTANPLATYHDEWNWEFITTERITRTIYRALTES